MKNTTRVNKAYLSVRLINIANANGLTTIGQLKKFLNNCNPDASVSIGFYSMKASLALKSLNKELNETLVA